jgi:hypothetical protein
MEGGLQPKPAAFVAGKSHAARVRKQNDVAKAGRMRPENKTRILPKAGGEMGLRSFAKASDSQTEPFARIRHNYFQLGQIVDA